MSESELVQPESSHEKTRQDSSGPSADPEVYPDEMKLEPLMRAEKLAAEIERFSALSSELRDLLSGLSREIKISAEQLNRIRSAIDLKRKELNTLHGIEGTIAELERLNREHLQKKESLDRAIESQRALWEEEKTRRIQEHKEYAENLQIRREREGEEYRQAWAAEKLKARQSLEEELKTIQQEALQKQQALERDCLERELALKEKELEWVQLIQELEQFMSKLIRRSQAQTAALSAEKGNLPASPGTAAGPASPSGEQNSGPALAGEVPAEPGAAISSLKEMLLSQGRRIESLGSEAPKR
jgi:DNA repair exonuclease SbcCD ATPase subunit